MEHFTLDTNLTTLEDTQIKAWLENFNNLIEDHFKNCNNDQRLLANLLVLTRYYNTLQQGFAKQQKQLSLGLQTAITLLWNFLDKKVISPEFVDFSNDLYFCYYTDSVGVPDELPEPFYSNYFGKAQPDAYEWMAIEWAAGLSMQLVSIHGKRLDFEDFEDCQHIDFYGIHLLLDQLEHIAQSNIIPPFQEIAQIVQHDLQQAKTAPPKTYPLLQNIYQTHTLFPAPYSQNLLNY